MRSRGNSGWENTGIFLLTVKQVVSVLDSLVGIIINTISIYCHSKSEAHVKIIFKGGTLGFRNKFIFMNDPKGNTVFTLSGISYKTSF